ncbi:MAG: choline dehydrogenase-like flavoprotein [Crocinitomicaceae bacterium]|jgi:choline dehydrogenase-like flavoprotein
MAVPDIFKQRSQSENWDLNNASNIQSDATIEADVIIIGTGAGGGVTAEVLSQAGLKVVMIEEGGLKTSDDFNMDEIKAYGDLYQEGAARATKDGAFSIFQGRTVGGTTVVNWTSSFRTPASTLTHWKDVHGVKGLSPAEMKPYFEQMEKRLNVEKWKMAPNANNDILKKGCEKNNWSWSVIPRNVAGCWDLGYCGTGCPTNAKQSMLVTTVPEALKNGGSLYYNCSAHKLVFSNNKVESVECIAIGKDGKTPTGVKLSFKAKHIVLSGGGINNPGLLLRSNAPDPHNRIGKNTTIHPVNANVAKMPDTVNPFYGAPQSIYSDQFQWPADGEMGFKLEVPPMQPAMGGQILGFHGFRLVDTMKDLPNLQGTIALMRDGFTEESQGGSVELDSGGKPILDYPLTGYIWKGLRKAHHAMAEIQFAAGAKQVMPLHHDATFYKTLAECKIAIDKLPQEIHRQRLLTAHIMGGCSMGEDQRTSVINSDGRFHHADNLSIIDGSVFPTSIGANPQLSVYGLALKMATNLAKQLQSS